MPNTPLIPLVTLGTYNRHMSLHLYMTFSCIYVFGLPYTFCVHTSQQMPLCHTHTCTRFCVADAAHVTSCVSSAHWWCGCQSTLPPHLPKRAAGRDVSTVRTPPCICLVHQCIYRTFWPSGSSHTESHMQSPRYCRAFAHHYDSLHITAKLRRCFRG